jgi:aminodeoxyfutalosine deaminase
MKYRKFRADHLFNGRQFLNGENVLITDESGQVYGIAPAAEHPDADYFPGTISPGFVNMHCHLELSWMKDMISRGTGMIDFLLSVIKSKPQSQDAVSAAARKAEEQMIDAGIVAVGDICNSTGTLLLKRENNLYYHNFIEVTGIDPATAKQRYDHSINIFREFAQDRQMPMLHNSLVPHAPYSVSEELLQKILSFPGNQLLTIHNQEHASENELFLYGSGDFHRLYIAIGFDSRSIVPTGASSVTRILTGLSENQSVVLVHNVDTGDADLELMKQTFKKGVKCILCLCPNANLYINLTIGTDSLASNSSLDILAELKTIHQHFAELSISRLLEWATINGAVALGIDDTAGSFDTNKQPGVVWLRQVTPLSIDDMASAQRLL